MQNDDGVDFSREDIEHVEKWLTYANMADLIASRKDLFLITGDMLISRFGFTVADLLDIETLAAWDYGRTSIIARYGYAAGYVTEDEAWHYLEIAAENAQPIYSSWREYAAAHILGRCIAYGNESSDMIEVLEYLFYSPHSPYKNIEW